MVVGSLEGDVVALDAATGAEKWISKVANEVLVAPAMGGGMVFVHSNDGRLTALDEATGERRWFYSPDMPALTVRGSGGITVGPGILFVGNANGTLTALSMSDGSVRWSTPVAQPDGRSETERRWRTWMARPSWTTPRCMPPATRTIQSPSTGPVAS